MWSLIVLQSNGDDALGGMMVLGALTLCVAAIMFVVIAAFLAGLWKLYEKAGQPGWSALVPFYSDYIRVQILGLPQQWFYYVLVATLLTYTTGWVAGIAPLILLVLNFFIMRPFLRAFGQPDDGVNVVLYLLFPFIMYPRLGFGPATYQGLPSLHDVPNLPWIDGGSSSATPPPAQPTNVPPVIGGPSDSGSGNAGSFIPTMGNNDKKDNN